MHLRLLTEEHLGYREIAQRLGVCEKTVQRDLKKLQRYHMGQLNRRMWQWRREQDRELKAKMAGMTNIQKFQFLTSEIIRRDSLLKGREYRRHYQIIHLDLTQPDEYGIPKLTISPGGHHTLAFPYKIRVHVRGRYKDKIFEAEIGGFNLVRKHGW